MQYALLKLHNYCAVTSCTPHTGVFTAISAGGLKTTFVWMDFQTQRTSVLVKHRSVAILQYFLTYRHSLRGW